MPLKTLVKVGNITNLSDARYCAGMGVDLLGFCVIEGQPNFVPVQLFQELRGWVAGPKVVAEFYGCHADTDFNAVIKNYAPEYAELSFQEYLKFQSLISLPFIVAISSEEISSITVNNYNNVVYWIVEEPMSEAIVKRDHNAEMLLKVTSNNNLLEKLKQYPIKGIVLNGSSEIRPGYKDYDQLADVLEALDE